MQRCQEQGPADWAEPGHWREGGETEDAEAQVEEQEVGGAQQRLEWDLGEKRN